MSYGMTRRQSELLAFIARYGATSGGAAPSFGEMAEALSLRSKSGIHRMVEALAERGAIARLPGRARSIAMTERGVAALAARPVLRRRRNRGA